MADVKNKVLVTGCAGFIGMHTVRKLVEEGFSVVGLDNINNYYSPKLKLARLGHLGIDTQKINENELMRSDQFSGFRFVKADIQDTHFLTTLFETENFDYVVHLAAQAGVRYSLENPDAYIKSNVDGFMNVLENCRRNKIKHLVFASSSSVYGLNEETPFKESDPADRPSSLYAATKKSNELMAHAYSHLFALPATGLRFFTVYGPWGRPDMALFLFTERITHDQPIEVFGNGKMMRDFTYIDDVVTAITRCMLHPPTGDITSGHDRPSPAAPYAVYNVGNSKPVPLLDYIEAIEKALNKKSFKLMKPIHPADVKTTYADISALKNHIGYDPKTPIESGVRNFVTWYLNYNSGKLRKSA